MVNKICCPEDASKKTGEGSSLKKNNNNNNSELPEMGRRLLSEVALLI